jgi:16S rRNA (adenine1518-N6/adenine1519-N6)-dimethyltransferase
VVLEVGCGTGSLTELLLESGARVVGVEIDHGLQALLRERLGHEHRLTLVQGDALAGKHRVNPLVLAALRQNPPESSGAYKLVANLPYQIATPLLLDLLFVEPRFETLVCTIQREVAERLAAQAGEEPYGAVSVLTQSLARVEPLRILPPTAFWPRPKVHSIMVRLTPLPPEQVEVSEPRAFALFVQRGFQQRRKMLRRVFADWEDAPAALVYSRAQINPQSRPENISPPAWRALFEAARHARLA